MNTLTIIVPVYNMSQYLRECVDSILGQSLQEFELLLVDDGSTDDSGKICDEYAALDSRVRVIHKQNSGLLSTRVSSVHEATSEYVAFVDADDFVHPQMYRKMMTEQEKYGADYVVCGFYFYDNPFFVREVNEAAKPGIYTGELLKEQKIRILKSHVADGRTFGYPWNKIFRKDALMKILDKIDPNVTMHEDETFTYPYLMQAKSMVVLSDRLYFYRRREGSMSRSASLARLRNAEKIINSFSALEGLDQEFLQAEIRNRISWGFMELVTDEQYRGIPHLYANMKEKLEVLKNDPYWSQEFERRNVDAFRGFRDRHCYLECVSGRKPVFTALSLTYRLLKRKPRILFKNMLLRFRIRIPQYDSAQRMK